MRSGPESAQLFLELVELVANAAEDPLVFLGDDGLTQRGTKLLEQLPLILGQVGGRHDANADQLVAATAAAQVRHAFLPELEDAAALRPGGDLEVQLAVERRDLDLVAERCLSKVQRQVENEVIAVA